jgi:hypothetical protein
LKILILVESFNNSSGGSANKILTQNLLRVFPNSKVYVGGKQTFADSRVFLIKRPITFLKVSAKVQEILSKTVKLNFHTFIEKKIGFSFNFYYDVFCIKQAVKLENHENYDSIITLSQGASFRPHYTVLIHFPQWHRKWIANMHDPFPFHHYPRPYNFVRHNYKAQEHLMKGIASRAAVATFPSGELAKWMSSYYQFQHVLVIPHQIDQNPINENLGIIEDEYLTFIRPNIFNVVHIGTLLSERYIIALLDTFQQFASVYEDVSLSFVGPIADNHVRALDYARSQTNGRINYLNKRIPFEQAKLLHKEVSVNLIIEANSEISPFLPGKFPHCVQANRPILSLSPYYSEMKNLMGKDYKYLKQADDYEGIKIALQELYNHWKLNTTEEITKDYDKFNQYLSLSYLKEELSKLKTSNCLS